MEHFFCPLVEVKFDQRGDNDGTVRGYGSAFGNVDSYGDTVAKGAFKKTIEEIKSGASPWPPMLLQHGASDQNPIGIWTHLDEDEKGLRLRGQLAIKTRRGLEAYNLLKMQPRPALNGLSIGFRAKDYELHHSGPVKRTLKAIDLVECSLVTFPADKFARVASVKFAVIEPVEEAVSMKEFAIMEFEKLRRLVNHVPR
jgi:HK97 family phage prohead protease